MIVEKYDRPKNDHLKNTTVEKGNKEIIKINKYLNDI